MDRRGRVSAALRMPGAQNFRPINRPGGYSNARQMRDDVGKPCGAREHTERRLFIAAIFMWIDYFSKRPEIARVRHALAYCIVRDNNNNNTGPSRVLHNGRVSSRHLFALFPNVGRRVGS